MTENTKLIQNKTVLQKPKCNIVFICEFPKPRKAKADYHKIVYLDQINDPGNLGTILRTAVAFDYDFVILSEGSVDLFNEKVIAASKGAIFLVDAFVGDINDYIDSHKIIVSTLDEKSVPLNDSPKYQNFVLVLGNESHGVSEPIIKIASNLVKIEMNDVIDSLNVAIAGAILMNYYR